MGAQLRANLDNFVCARLLPAGFYFLRIAVLPASRSTW